MPAHSDDTISVCLEFILQKYGQHAKEQTDHHCSPLFLGVSGVQGCGKTTLVANIARLLRQSPHRLQAIVISLDDFYLTREQQTDLASKHPDNALIQCRGQPSTHDIGLGISVLSDLRRRESTRIPVYDKSAHNGIGDRLDYDRWHVVDRNKALAIQIVILEGWCIGFRALDDVDLFDKWQSAVTLKGQEAGFGRLRYCSLQDVKYVNDALRDYDDLTNSLDIVIHLDAANTSYAYGWRSDQETHLRNSTGSGMSPDQVVKFVNAYYPSYELYIDQLRRGALTGSSYKQLRVVIRQDRSVSSVHTV